MKTGTKFKQRANATGDGDAACRGCEYASEQFQQRGFAGAVLADQAQRFTATHAQVDVLQYRYRFRVAATQQQLQQRAQAITRTEHQWIGFAQSAGFDEDAVVHRKSSKCGPSRRNTT